MSWGLEETCCHSNSSEKPSANVDVKNSNNNKDKGTGRLEGWRTGGDHPNDNIIEKG